MKSGGIACPSFPAAPITSRIRFFVSKCSPSSASTSPTVALPPAMVRPLNGMFQTSLRQRSVIRFSTSRVSMPALANASTIARVRGCEGLLNSPIDSVPCPKFSTMPGTVRFRHTKHSPPITRSTPNRSARNSSLPSPFCSVSSTVPGLSSGGISFSRSPLDVVFTEMTTTSHGPMSPVAPCAFTFFRCSTSSPERSVSPFRRTASRSRRMRKCTSHPACASLPP